MKRPAQQAGGITVNALAVETGMDRRTVSRRLALLQPIREDGAAKHYDRVAALELLRQPDNDRADLRAARLRRELAEAGLKEHRLALAKRNAIPADEMRRTFTRYAIAARSKAFAAMKTAAQESGLVLGLTSDQMLIVEEKATARLRGAYEELSRCEWNGCPCPQHESN